MPSLPTGTVTFLFADIEGSTTLLQRLGDRRSAEVLAEHQRVFRDAFAKGNGQEKFERRANGVKWSPNIVRAS